MRIMIARLDEKGWEPVIVAEQSLGAAFQVAEYASTIPAPTEARVVLVESEEPVAIFRDGLCVRLRGRPVP